MQWNLVMEMIQTSNRTTHWSRLPFLLYKNPPQKCQTANLSVIFYLDSSWQWTHFDQKLLIPQHIFTPHTANKNGQVIHHSLNEYGKDMWLHCLAVGISPDLFLVDITDLYLSEFTIIWSSENCFIVERFHF